MKRVRVKLVERKLEVRPLPTGPFTTDRPVSEEVRRIIAEAQAALIRRARRR